MTIMYFPPIDKQSYQRINVDVIEERYNALYIGDFCLKTKGGNWSEFPVAIFYQKTPSKPEYSNYFGIYEHNGRVYITDGASAFSQPLVGAVANNGEIIISRYRHDCVTSSDGTVMIDGGRDYVRTNTEKTVQISMIDGKLTVGVPRRFSKLSRKR